MSSAMPMMYARCKGTLHKRNSLLVGKILDESPRRESVFIGVTAPGGRFELGIPLATLFSGLSLVTPRLQGSDLRLKDFDSKCSTPRWWGGKGSIHTLAERQEIKKSATNREGRSSAEERKLSEPSPTSATPLLAAVIPVYPRRYFRL